MFQTSDNSQLCIDSQYSSQQLTVVSSLKHKSTQPLYIFNRENPQNSESQNGLRRGLDFIALSVTNLIFFFIFWMGAANNNLIGGMAMRLRVSFAGPNGAGSFFKSYFQTPQPFDDEIISERKKIVHDHSVLEQI